MPSIIRKILNSVIIVSFACSLATAKPQERRGTKLTKVLVAAAVNASLIASNPFFAELEAWRSSYVNITPELEHNSKVV